MKATKGTESLLGGSSRVVMRIFKIDVPNIPTIARIFALCKKHEAFARAEPGRQVGAPAG